MQTVIDNGSQEKDRPVILDSAKQVELIGDQNSALLAENEGALTTADKALDSSLSELDASKDANAALSASKPEMDDEPVTLTRPKPSDDEKNAPVDTENSDAKPKQAGPTTQSNPPSKKEEEGKGIDLAASLKRTVEANKSGFVTALAKTRAAQAVLGPLSAVVQYNVIDPLKKSVQDRVNPIKDAINTNVISPVTAKGEQILSRLTGKTPSASIEPKATPAPDAKATAEAKKDNDDDNGPEYDASRKNK